MPKITHGMAKTRTYKSWTKMKERCLNKNHRTYKYYGGRGIMISKEWINSFENFLADMGERPKGKSLDRIKNNLGYCKENCKWSTPKEQSNNTRYNRFLTYKGETKTIAQWARKLNIKYHAIYSRIRKKRNIEEILNSSQTGLPPNF